MRAFCKLDLGNDAIPDETTILNFRHRLETHELTKMVFEAVAKHLEGRGALLRDGTIVDATLIAASPSTKNEAGQRDPEMRSSKKGNQWYFGMKAHIGVDARSGLVHTAGVTSGSVHDAKVMDCWSALTTPRYMETRATLATGRKARPKRRVCSGR